MSNDHGPEMWREGRGAAEAFSLLRSSLWRGHGVAHGDGQPVMLIPGFLAGDRSLSLMGQWLRRIGYRTHGSGLSAHVGCSEQTVNEIEQRVIALSERYGQPVALIGQSRGGSCARVLAVRQPDRVNRVIGLGSPLVAQMEDFHMLLRIQIRALQRAQRLGAPGLIGEACERSWQAYTFGLEPSGCCSQFWADLDEDMPERTLFASIYSRSDGVLNWRACLDPAALQIEVNSSHCGMAVNREVYEQVGTLLQIELAGGARQRLRSVAA
jgi:triacylglycerol lipase